MAWLEVRHLTLHLLLVLCESLDLESEVEKSQGFLWSRSRVDNLSFWDFLLYLNGGILLQPRGRYHLICAFVLSVATNRYQPFQVGSDSMSCHPILQLLVKVLHGNIFAKRKTASEKWQSKFVSQYTFTNKRLWSSECLIACMQYERG